MRYDRYERYFVMLNEQDTDFEMRPSTRADGHIKIETGRGRGVMSVTVRNIKPYEDGEYVYKLILFGTADGEMLYKIMGDIDISLTGTGEAVFGFVPADTDGKGHGISEFSYAVVAAAPTRNEKEELHAVLKGDIEERGYEEGEDEKENGYERSCFNSYYNEYLLETCRALDSGKEIYDRVVPFREDLTGAEWTKMNDIVGFPLVSPGAVKLAERYRHYIFGKDSGYYYFGIPGRFMKEEQPEEGRSGFRLWQPITGAEEYDATAEDSSDEIRSMAYGYWIISVDMKTGDILEV